MIKNSYNLLKRLDNLVQLRNVCGDLHMHTIASDGTATLDQIVQVALEKKYQYIGITDHSIGNILANGLNEDRIKQQWKQIDKAREKYGATGLKIYKGTECEVDKDGEIDWPDRILTEFNYVIIAPTHRGQKSLENRIISAIVKLAKLKVFTIVAHPTGRQFGKTDLPKDVNWDNIFQIAAKCSAVFEINSIANRLDLPDFLVRKAIKHKVKIAINTDAHDLEMLDGITLGIAVARRAAVVPTEVINCHTDPFDSNSEIYEKPSRKRKELRITI